MELCEVYGLPHSSLLMWDELDLAKAKALRREKAAECGRCRTRADEWDPDQGGSRRAYNPTSRTCLGCERMDLLQESDQEALPKGQKLRGRYYYLTKQVV